MLLRETILICPITIFVAGGGNPFQNLEKTSVLQETRLFNETPVHARKCTHILTKILYLINQVRYQYNKFACFEVIGVF